MYGFLPENQYSYAPQGRFNDGLTPHPSENSSQFI